MGNSSPEGHEASPPGAGLPGPRVSLGPPASPVPSVTAAWLTPPCAPPSPGGSHPNLREKLTGPSPKVPCSSLCCSDRGYKDKKLSEDQPGEGVVCSGPDGGAQGSGAHLWGLCVCADSVDAGLLGGRREPGVGSGTAGGDTDREAGGGSDSASSLPGVSQRSPVPGGAGSCLAVHQVPGRPPGCGLWSRGLFPPFLLVPLSFPLLLLLFQLSKHSGIRAQKVSLKRTRAWGKADMPQLKPDETERIGNRIPEEGADWKQRGRWCLSRRPGRGGVGVD